MEKTAKIYVAGHNGLVGKSVVRALKAAGYHNILTMSHQVLDLCDAVKVSEFFTCHRPEYVILAAAKVGGILANSRYPADFIQQNLNIQNNVLHQAKLHDVKRLIFLGSSCIYPRDCPQPIKEEYLLTGPLELSNRPYALAKIAGIEMCWAYNRQFGTQFMAMMPTNLYGPGDNYDLNNSHVIPALIRKMHEAKANRQNTVEVWGTGQPKREFMFSDDLADACLFLLNLGQKQFEQLVHKLEQPPVLNIGCGKDITIEALARLIAATVEFDGEIQFNAQYPDGTPQKLLDVSKMEQLGWRAKTSLTDGLQSTYEKYIEQLAQPQQDQESRNSIGVS